jgi:hypothetical protein
VNGGAEAPAVSAGAFGPGTHSLEQTLRVAATDLSGVISTMQAIVDALPPADGVCAFTTLYLAVTQAVAGSADGQSFEDDRFTRALDVTFANLYFTALRDFVAGDGSIPAAWTPLVEARGRTDVCPLQFALAGMNAHINRDLPVALVETCTALGVEPRDASPQHRDFQRIDGVLARTEALVKTRFITGDLAAADVALGQLDDCVAMWNVELAREAAWTNAQTLWALRGVPLLSARFLLTLDRMVGFAGRGLLRPLVPVTSPPVPVKPIA